MTDSTQAPSEATEASNQEPEQAIESLLMDELGLQTGEENTENQPTTDADQDDTEEEADQAEDDESTEENAEGEENAEDNDAPETWGAALGIDDEQIILDEQGNLKAFKAKIFGEEREVSAKDLIKSYQLEESTQIKSQKLAEEQKKFQADAQARVDELTQAANTNAQMMQFIEKNLLAEFENVNWDELRHTDPGEHAALRTDYAEKYGQLQRMKNKVSQQMQEVTQQQQMQYQQQMQQKLATEAQLAIEARPHWKDEMVRVKELNEMSDFMQQQYHYTADEIDGITDHRLFDVIYDLMKSKKDTQQINEKLLKPKPKFVKPRGKTNVKSAQSKSTAKLEQTFKRAAASRDVRDKDAAIEKLLLQAGNI